jgi:hypothetical protein
VELLKGSALGLEVVSQCVQFLLQSHDLRLIVLNQPHLLLLKRRVCKGKEIFLSSVKQTLK